MRNNVAQQNIIAPLQSVQSVEIISLLSDDEEDGHGNNVNDNDVQVIKLDIILFIDINKYLNYCSY